METGAFQGPLVLRQGVFKVILSRAKDLPGRHEEMLCCAQHDGPGDLEKTLVLRMLDRNLSERSTYGVLQYGAINKSLVAFPPVAWASAAYAFRQPDSVAMGFPRRAEQVQGVQSPW